jgi:uncharacterized protein (TIGR03435 family)
MRIKTHAVAGRPVQINTVLSLYLTAAGLTPPGPGAVPAIVDNTGLTRKYDFDLEYAGPRAADAAGPTLFNALEKQLGLKLEQKKTTLDLLVIDHAEKTPTGN